ncbi:WW domain-containing oxidoreductase [Microdochium nivale]|nr:WW domain-containing oxidoreductase [Microdochium nivale]
MPGPNDNKFDPNTDIPSLSGRVYIVTGGSAGIGYGISAHLLQHDAAKIYLLGKKEEHLQEAQDGLAEYGDVSRVELVQCDLESLRATDKVARQLASTLERLDALILNAGLGVGPYAESAEDRLETHMQVNVVSQHHLAMTLLPVLAKTKGSRLCLQSSEMHRMGTSGVRFLSLEEINHDIGPTALYGRSKLAQICLVRAMYRRKQQGLLLANKGTAATAPPSGGDGAATAASVSIDSSRGPILMATHPGGVVTDQQDQAVEAYGLLGRIGVAMARPFMKDPVDQGCRPMLFAATADDVATLADDIYDGSYIVPDCKVADASGQALDEELQERCWTLVQGIIKDRLGAVGADEVRELGQKASVA